MLLGAAARLFPVLFSGHRLFFIHGNISYFFWRITNMLPVSAYQERPLTILERGIVFNGKNPYLRNRSIIKSISAYCPVDFFFKHGKVMLIGDFLSVCKEKLIDMLHRFELGTNASRIFFLKAVEIGRYQGKYAAIGKHGVEFGKIRLHVRKVLHNVEKRYEFVPVRGDEFSSG